MTYLGAIDKGLDSSQNREVLAAKVSQIVFDTVKALQGVLNEDVSVFNTFNAPLPSIPLRLELRNSIKKAKDQIQGPFLSAALNAIRDKTRNLDDTLDTINSYLDALADQVDAAAKAASDTSFTAVVFEALRVGKQMIKKTFQTAGSAVGDVLPWWMWGIVAVAGLGTIGYFVRSIK